LVLQRIAQLLLEQFRGEDIVARWGGEEIALALYGMTSADGVRRLTDALGLLRDQAITVPSGQSLHISFSAGVSEYKVDGTALHDLYLRADESLYLAKSFGRARVLPAGWEPNQQADNQTTEDIVVKNVKDH
jgi:diguanylate cyclase (GGDEF)-like protein